MTAEARVLPQAAVTANKSKEIRKRVGLLFITVKIWAQSQKRH